MSNVLFLLSHQPNPRFVKQINFLSKHNDISVLYYDRDSLNDLSEQYKNACVLNKSMGTISNGNYLGRSRNYLKSIIDLFNVLKQHKHETIIVNNIDTLAIYKLCTIFSKSKSQIIIEISDLRSHTYTNSMKSKVLRYFESKMFRFVDKLIVTSPKFYDMHYSKLFFKQPFILENKPLKSMMPTRLKKQENQKIIIGIVGMLLQGKPYEALFETIKNDDRFEVHVYGKGDYQGLVEMYAKKYSNIIYFGEYNLFKDSAKIYASLDIIYMSYDTTNGSLNNKVALPNKLYEAMYFRVPILTSKDTYLGELVEKHDIGVTVSCCNKGELENAIKILSGKKIQYEKSFDSLNDNMYIADNDYIELEKYINI